MCNASGCLENMEQQRVNGHDRVRIKIALINHLFPFRARGVSFYVFVCEFLPNKSIKWYWTTPKHFCSRIINRLCIVWAPHTSRSMLWCDVDRMAKTKSGEMWKRGKNALQNVIAKSVAFKFTVTIQSAPCALSAWITESAAINEQTSIRIHMFQCGRDIDWLNIDIVFIDVAAARTLSQFKVDSIYWFMNAAILNILSKRTFALNNDLQTAL